MESAMKKGSSTESQGRIQIALFRFALNGSEQLFFYLKYVKLYIKGDQCYVVLIVSV
jgi:hypothetical protein